MRDAIQQRLADATSMGMPALIDRDIRIPAIPNKVYSVIGIRRSGKTYFLYQIMKRLIAGGVERTRLVYINFEDERLADITNADLHWILDEYFVLFPENRSRKVFFFFDEIQLVTGWEGFIRRLMDTEDVQVYVSGSSAKMLSREIATSLRGRSVEIVIYPYDFREYARYNDVDYSRSLNHINSRMRSLLENKLIQYLNDGGFPEAQGLLQIDRQLLLQGYVNTVLFRDVVERHSVTNITVLKALIRHLIRNAGSRFTVNKFYNDLKSQGFKVSKSSLYEYLEYLRDAFLLHTIPVYTSSERKRMVNPVKPYVIDTGLLAAFAVTRGQDLGHLLENCVFIELCRRNAEVTYAMTPSGFEVDFFVAYPDGTRQAIQVAADVSNQIARQRECRALVEVHPSAPDAELILINLSEEMDTKIDDVPIRLIPAWKWLLDKP